LVRRWHRPGRRLVPVFIYIVSIISRIPSTPGDIDHGTICGKVDKQLAYTPLGGRTADVIQKGITILIIARLQVVYIPYYRFDVAPYRNKAIDPAVFIGDPGAPPPFPGKPVLQKNLR
jgi:hypothetical protein